MLNELSSHHREIARLRFEGKRPVEISTMLNMPISTIRNILADPMCKAHIERLTDSADTEVINVRRRLAEMNAKALATIDDLLSHDDVSHSVQLKAAQDVLNRNGYAPIQTHQHMHAHLTGEDLAKMKARALASGAIISGDGEEED